MLTDKQRWWAELALDLLFSVVVGWFLLGAIASAILMPMVIDPKDPGELAKALPILVQIAVTYGAWKLSRSLNWLKGVPPSTAR